MGKSYSLSIAIVTKNRSHSLLRALKSLRQQNVSPFEVLISDDSDIELEIMTNQRICVEFNANYYVGPKRGLYANRNFIASLCSGTHIRTMDDDHQFSLDHLKVCMNAIQKEPNSIWVISEKMFNNGCLVNDISIPGQLTPRGFSLPPTKIDDYYGISCGGTIYPSSIFKLGIKNCELFKFGYSYLEFGARLKYLGYVIKPLSDTWLIHNSDQTFGSNVQKSEINRSRLFAMISFSFLYQPKIRNITLTLFQIIIDLLRIKFTVIDLFVVLKHYHNFKYEFNRISNLHAPNI
jgi:glycosyltransferase involved in cell wall biosynthesis